jgi:hypothetical protein
VTINVELPRDLTPEQRALFESLKRLEDGTKTPCSVTPLRSRFYVRRSANDEPRNAERRTSNEERMP